jgi:hypothetical protein
VQKSTYNILQYLTADLVKEVNNTTGKSGNTKQPSRYVVVVVLGAFLEKLGTRMMNAMDPLHPTSKSSGLDPTCCQPVRSNVCPVWQVFNDFQRDHLEAMSRYDAICFSSSC